MQISTWATDLIISQGTHKQRREVLSCLLRVCLTCWNFGSFNVVAELLDGLRSKPLRPFWLSSKDDDVSLVDILAHNLLSRHSLTDYCTYVGSPHCTVVPFLGSLLADLEEIFTDVSAVVLVTGANEWENFEVIYNFYLA